MKKASEFLMENHAIRSLFVFTLLSALTIAVYQDIYSHSFINYDDSRIITSRADKYDGFNIENIQDIVFDDYPREEPLIIRDLSYLVNAEAFGALNPLGYLIGNVLLHIITAFLIYRLCLHLLPKQYSIALIAAIIFAIHPANVESVAWISSRKNPLFTIFTLLAFISYIKYTEKRHTKHLITSALIFPVALLSKASAICLPPILLCYRFILKRDTHWSWRETTYYSAIFITTAGFIIWYSGVIQEYGVIERLTTDRDFTLLLLSASEYITFYIGKLIAPFELSAFYDFPSPFLVYEDISYLIVSLLVITAILVISLDLFKKNRNNALFLIALFLGALTPHLGLTSVDIHVADRYLYLSSAAYAIGVAWAIVFLYGKYSESSATKSIVVIVAVLYCTLLAARTIQATKTWESTFTFWLNANQTSPDSIETYRGLISQYTQFAYELPDDPYSKTALANAKTIGFRALERFCPSNDNCNPQVFSITSALGNIYALEGDYERSDYYYGITFSIKPNYIKGRYHYAIDLLARKDYKNALQQIIYIENNANPHRHSNTLKEIRDVLRPQIPLDTIATPLNSENRLQP